MYIIITVCASNMKETLTDGITLIRVSSHRQFTRDTLVLQMMEESFVSEIIHFTCVFYLALLLIFVVFLFKLLVPLKKSVKKKKTSKHFSEVLKYLYGCD